MNLNTFSHHLKEEVDAKIQHEPRLRGLPIEVFNHNGVFILQGEVPSESISMLVEDIVREVDGVISISNELYIKAR